jgi:hypothetical protein
MGIRFFEKNKIDRSLDTLVTIAVTDGVATDAGQSFVDYVRNRRNDSGWATTNSTDAANTQLDIDFGEGHEIDTIFFIGINWKAYTCQYWDGVAYQDFSTPISVSGNSDDVKVHEFNDLETSKIRIIIAGTFVADTDKVCAQIVVTQAIGTLVTQPRLKEPVVSKNRKFLKALSGKGTVLRSSGAFQVVLTQKPIVVEADLALIENLHDYYEGFLVWLCGGDESQFSPGVRVGYRREDLFLMNIITEYKPEWNGGYFKQGIDIEMSLAEVL